MEAISREWSTTLADYVGGNLAPHPMLVTAARIVSVIRGPDGRIARVTVERDGKRREVVLNTELSKQFDVLDLQRPGASIIVQGDQLLGVLWSTPALAAKRKTESGGGEEDGATDDTETEAKGETETEAKGETETEAKDGTETEAKDGTETEAKGGTETEGKGGTETEGKDSTETEGKDGTEAKGGTETEGKDGTETKENITDAKSAGTVIDTSIGEIFPELKEGLEIPSPPIKTAWGTFTLKAKAQIKVTLRHPQSGKDSEGLAKAKIGLDQSQLKAELSNKMQTDFGEVKAIEPKFAPVTADFKKGKLKLGTGTLEATFSNGSKAAFALTGAQLSWTAGQVKADAGVIEVKLEHELALGDRALGDGWTATLSGVLSIQIELAPDYARIARAAGGGGAFFVVAGVASAFLVGGMTFNHFFQLWKTLKEHDHVVEEFNDRLAAYADGFAKGLADASTNRVTTMEYEDANLQAAWQSGYDTAGRVDTDAYEKFQKDPDVVAWLAEDPAADLRRQHRALMKVQRDDLIAAARTAVRPAIKRSIYEQFRAKMSGTLSSARALRDNVFQALYVPKSKYHYRTAEVDRALYALAMADNFLYRSPDVFPIPDYDTPADQAERSYLERKAKIENRTVESGGGPDDARSAWSKAVDGHLTGSATGPLQIYAATIKGLIQGHDGAIASVRVSIDGRDSELPVATLEVSKLLEDLPLSRPGLRVITDGGKLVGVLWAASQRVEM